MTWRDVPEVSEIGMLVSVSRMTRRDIDTLRCLTLYHSKSPISFVRLIESPCEDHEDHVITSVDLDRALSMLRSKSQEILRLRYWEGMTQEETASHFGFTGPRVSQIEASALKRLRTSMGV